MKYIFFFFITLSNVVLANSYYAEFGLFNSGYHSSAHSACIALGNLIYPNEYSRPVTGVSGSVNELQNSSCATDVSYASVGNVYWSSQNCHEPNEDGLCGTEPTVCEDGLPPIIDKYTNCDRPELQQCVDGSIVETSTGGCLSFCSDYDTCYQYAANNFSCEETANYFEFTYTNPENWSYTCTTIEDDSPDHPDNGGNQDGNTNNDPTSPETPSVNEVDPSTLATAIGDDLQDDFGNVERAIRDGISSAEENTNQITDSIDNFNADNAQGLTDIESAVRDVISGADDNTQQITDSLDGLSQQVSNLASSLDSDGSGQCDPTRADYYSCLDNPASPLPEHTQSPRTFDEANSQFKARIDNAPVVSSFSGISSMLSLENASCPEFSVDLPDPINESISTNIHCELYESIAGVLSTVMLIIWTFIGFRIFASA